MKMCQPHWNKIIQAVKDRGMWNLVSPSTEVALEGVKDQLEGREAPFDPLMSCNNMIFSRALELGGLYLMFGELCPICEAMLARKDMVDPDIGRPYTPEEEESWWIDGPADACLSRCRELGLVPKAQ